MALQAPTVPYEPETPFEGTLLPEPPAQEAPAAFEGFTTRTEVATPFLTEYWLGEDSTAISPATSELVDLVEELWDHEFDELTYRLTQEAAAAADDRFPQGEEPGDPTARERFLEGYLEPLHSAAERLFETVAEAVSEHDLMAMSESELDSVLGSLEVGETDLSPTFEGFLGGLLKKAKTLAKGAWSLAKKGISAAGRLLPIGALLSKLKALVRPLLQRVLRFALGKLPPSLRPAASQLAKRILPTIGMGELDSEELEEPTTADVRVIQQELDLGAAALLLAADETEGEVALAEVAMEAANGDGEALARLDHARQRFTEEITQLPEGEDPTQAVENFLPAILPLVKTGIGLIGRPRVVNFLARYLATLIQRYVGRENSAPLSRAIVDAGLRMISLEAPPEVERQAAGAALAATLENTVRHVAELDEMFFEDEDLLAHETYRGFESAAAGNMPPATLRRALRPTAGLDGTWVLMPADSPAKGYKKYSRVLDTEITPQIARELETFGGTALDTFLRERDGDRDTVAARAHLYEAVPGTSLQRLTRLERDVPGLGPAGSTEPPVIHPLSTHAAGLLFREPGLGRDVSTAYLSDPDQIAVGQRLFYLELAGAPPPSPMHRRRNQAHVTVDLRAGREIRLDLFFSEAQAQRLAAEINRGADPAAVLSLVKGAVEEAVRKTLGGRLHRRVRFVFEDQLPGWSSRWLARLNGVVRRLGPTLLDWLYRGIAAHAPFAREFAEAAGSERDGVTVAVRFQNVAGLDALGGLLRLRPTPEKLRGLSFGPPERTTVEVVAGFRR